MPFIMDWMIPGKILYSASYGVLTADDLRQQVQAVDHFVEQSNTPFHYMADGTHIEVRKIALKDLRVIFQNKNRDPKLRLIVAVDPSALARFFTSTIMYVSRTNGRQVATVEDGLRLLASRDSTLPPLEELLSAWQALNARMQTRMGKREQ